jgi:hypothetical protein
MSPYIYFAPPGNQAQKQRRKIVVTMACVTKKYTNRIVPRHRIAKKSSLIELFWSKGSLLNKGVVVRTL